ncbi:MAG TPA: sigma 54-interacting transcriptional regulator [Blastocatellia bacterium]|nr:sigma 54-interacting transcriptional regulator [Blastocatellia bacterium]
MCISSAETSEAFKALWEQVSDALFIINPKDLRILEVNRNVAPLLGYSDSEILQLKADQIIPRLCDSLEMELNGRLTERAFIIDKEGRNVERDLRLCATTYQGQDSLLLIASSGRMKSPDPPFEARMNSEASADSRDREDLIETTLDFPSIIGQSEQIHKVCRLIGLVAKTDTTVLIQGESGTGKELVAQAIHFHSRRARGPLIKVNCAALTETLLESELFGHKRGSFTGAIQDRKGRFKLADGGTIILDEIGSMSLSGQAKLLRVLQEKEFEPVGESLSVKVNVRVVAITNTDLMKAIEEGKFREDLYYRLNAFPIHLPPLRERKVDIPLLARHFLKSYATSLKKQIEHIELDSMQALMNYCWPGNVREMENAIEYAVILEKDKSMQVKSLPDKLRREEDRNSSLKGRLELAERQIILEALSGADWVKNRAAKLLGIDPRNLNYFLNKHGIH